MAEFPVGIGPQFEGEAIRKGQFQVEFGGPEVKNKLEWCTIKGLDEVEHEKVEVIGPDLSEMTEGGSYSFGLLVEVAGSQLEKELEPVLERRIHMYSNYIEGYWHMAQRDTIWVRLAKTSYKKGINSLKKIGEILIFLYTSEIPIIEKIAITFITDEKKVVELLPKAREVFKARDDRVLGMKDEQVTEFYGCVLCQSFAPTHVCIITPERVSLCGAINWFDGKAAYKLDPEGPVFAVEKGELLDPVRIEYSGVNKIVAERSLGGAQRFYLHSAFGFPCTSCGCFQSILFYIPEVDAFGLVNREFVGPMVTGVPFSTLAGDVSGGRQNEGFVGMAVDYLRSPKFIQADGGLYRIVWLPKAIKERLKESIPTELCDKIATEEEAKNVEELQEFLNRVGHPWVKGEVKLPA